MTSRRTGVNNVCNTNHNRDNHSKVEREETEIFKEDNKTTPKEGQSTEEEKMTKHIDTRRRIQGIADISSFTDLLDKTTLSDEDKHLLKLHYIQGKDFRYIGDMLGYSESTIKRRHKKALVKISKLL